MAGPYCTVEPSAPHTRNPGPDWGMGLGAKIITSSHITQDQQRQILYNLVYVQHNHILISSQDVKKKKKMWRCECTCIKIDNVNWLYYHLLLSCHGHIDDLTSPHLGDLIRLTDRPNLIRESLSKYTTLLNLNHIFRRPPPPPHPLLSPLSKKPRLATCYIILLIWTGLLSRYLPKVCDLS